MNIKNKGVITNIQKFSLHDGPGIRTTVFLKGCNMKCLWCQNPEAIEHTPQLAYYQAKCIGCKSCTAACPTGKLQLEPWAYQHQQDCLHCFHCTEVCPTGALTILGKEMTAEEVFEQILSDAPYYKTSGGGVTISGGEPLFQAGFTREILRLCHEAGIDTAIETNLSYPFKLLEDILPYLNRVFFDLKNIDDTIHRRNTGISNQQVLENSRRLSEKGIPLVVRTPLIPGCTDDDENIRGIAAFIASLNNVLYYELLNYNMFAKAKYSNIGILYTLMDAQLLSNERVAALKNIACEQGVKVIFGKE